MSITGASPPEEVNASEAGRHRLSLASEAFSDVQIKLRARLGDISMTLGDVLQMRVGTVLKLDARLSEPVEVWLNESLLARGEIVAVDDHYGIRLVEVASVP